MHWTDQVPGKTFLKLQKKKQKSTKATQLFSTIHFQQIIHIYWTLNPHISKTGVTAEIHYRNKLHYRTVIYNSNNILTYYCFYCIFDQINAALMSTGHLHEHKKSASDQQSLTSNFALELHSKLKLLCFQLQIIWDVEMSFPKTIFRSIFAGMLHY